MGWGAGEEAGALSTSPPALVGSGGVQGTPLLTPRGLQQELAEHEAVAMGMWMTDTFLSSQILL